MDPRALAQHLRFYQELGVAGISRDAAWRLRAREQGGFRLNREATPAQERLPASAGRMPPAPGESADPAVIPLQILRSPEALAAIREELGECTRCKLHKGRIKLVFGTGNAEARLMFVGEGPGAEEDEQGVPFVGRAGQLLTQIIKAMGLEREDVYIANVVKCRPPGNRNPEPDEIEQCEPFLMRQMDVIKPAVVVALGKFAAQTLLRSTEPISKIRGRFHQVGDTRVMPTFHPSYLLRNPAAKREVWEDMKAVMGVLRGNEK